MSDKSNESVHPRSQTVDLQHQAAVQYAQELDRSRNAAVGKSGNILDMDVPDLLSVLATRVTDPGSMFASSVDRYSLTGATGQIQLGGPMQELGQKIALRCGRALHDFLCDQSNENEQLRGSILQTILGRDVSGIGLVSGALVTLLGIAPSIAVVVAAILIKVLVAPTLEVLCKEWNSKLTQGLNAALPHKSQ